MLEEKIEGWAQQEANLGGNVEHEEDGGPLLTLC
jgi:hypothetical protein